MEMVEQVDQDSEWLFKPSSCSHSLPQPFPHTLSIHMCLHGQETHDDPITQVMALDSERTKVVHSFNERY